MGLDMYAYAEKQMDTANWFTPVATPVPVHGPWCWDDEHSDYISGWSFGDTAPDARYAPAVAALGMTPSAGSPHINVCAHALAPCVAYWRKANAIHGWFVIHVQDGIDECQMAPFDHVTLGLLVATCRRALATREVGELKPTQGFFFGNYEIDEWYWADLQDTIDQLVPLAEWPGQFWYRSSW